VNDTREVQVYRVKIKYDSGYADIGECDTDDEARATAGHATLRMIAGRDGITDVIAWEVSE
jgi:hypothetical protein